MLECMSVVELFIHLCLNPNLIMLRCAKALVFVGNSVCEGVGL